VAGNIGNTFLTGHGTAAEDSVRLQRRALYSSWPLWGYLFLADPMV
jgi:hypothetical protein